MFLHSGLYSISRSISFAVTSTVSDCNLLEKRHDCYTPGDLAGRLQSETVDVTAKLIERLIEYKPECKNICLSGGYAFGSGFQRAQL
jgi:hypothetical protein